MTRWTLVLLLLATLCGGAEAGRPVGSAFVLLRNGTVVRLALPDAAVAVRRRVGPAGYTGVEPGRFLARRGRAVYVLDPASHASLTALEAGTLTIRWRRPLEAGVRYRGVLLAGNRLYAYGHRPGRVVNPADGLREGAAVLTAVGVDGTAAGSWTVRPAERHWWWEWWGAAAADGRALALAWHGGCNAESGSLCTSGADLVDVSGGEPRACPRDRSQNGCIPEVHGAIEPYRGGWIATTGGEPLVVLDHRGQPVRKLHSGLRKDHLMSFALDASRGRLFVLGSCFLGREGLRVVSIATGRSRLVARGVCGSDPMPGPNGTILAVAAENVSPGYDLVVVSGSSGRVLGRRRLPGILALLRAS